MSKGLFITGTGTDVGKTYVTGLIVKKLHKAGKKAAYYKAAMSGNEKDEQGRLIPGDAVAVKKISNIEQDTDSMCPYVYENAVSPHLASRIEGNPVVMEKVINSYEELKPEYEYITVEGSGGILCPICFDEAKIQLEDVIQEMKLPCLIIADAGLGTINSVVLTYEYMKQKGIECKGIIFNHCHPGDVCEEDNRFMCEYMTGLKVLAFVQDGDTELSIDENELMSIYR
ncbi:MAG: dethiobiotin synthase [Agathobacter sp.]|nr:dethiobiotin synthase [Agathobacter sp.]MDY3796410.1 dethiobiotin synthase [Agathobacter sp.]